MRIYNSVDINMIEADLVESGCIFMKRSLREVHGGKYENTGTHSNSDRFKGIKKLYEKIKDLKDFTKQELIIAEAIWDAVDHIHWGLDISGRINDTFMEMIDGLEVAEIKMTDVNPKATLECIGSMITHLDEQEV